MRAINYRIIQLQKIVLFLLSFLLLHAALAQEQARWIIGLSGGSAVYQGELSQDGFGSLRGQTLVWGGGVQFRPSPYWSLGLQGHLGELTAEDAFYPDDAFRMNRRFSFQTNFYDLALLGRFFPLGLQRFQPQVGIGAGLLFYDPSPSLLDNQHLELADLIKDDLEADIPDQTWFIPIRFSLAYQFSSTFALEGGLQYNFTQTDYLDGVSAAGNPENYDRYGHVFLGATIHFGIASDIDQDGIPDAEDSCPLKPGSPRTNGCPDADDDGIRDSMDRCPMAAGKPEMEGCPDTDDDGIPDPYDRCPALFGEAETLGCPPMDSDGDGVMDHQDDCPTERGAADRRGCPAIDSDFDGLLDEDDHCPDHYGILLFDGCPDTDGDGIGDYNDACPNSSGDFSAGGCPQVAGPQQAAELLSAQILHFRVSSADLANFYLLDRIVSFLKRQPTFEIKIHGHADVEGREEAPAYLSLLRAERVKRYLIDSGVPEQQIYVRGFSNRERLYTGDSPVRSHLNRRVEFNLSEGN